ncbi:hypothetical protein [Oceanirhabdus sp. W0125-5]|uniref:hypothetical protein n=1 Tax=Oceanirhabdus sp. W0125-5 TaxID=2999116 RepID=UPI0022F2B5EA|nr:hypothetical protein [Oceanirhabdus sp. W0125-5]WBW96566.1 hypothetical protein OW730_23170 [Oceanirhabdus sp. W0125-5]
MKKLFTMILFLSILIVGCNQKNQRESDNVTSSTNPPKLTVTVDNKSITGVLGTYSWTVDNGDGTETSIQSDSEAPPELAKDQKEPLNIKPSSSIILNFKNEPKEYIVTLWKDNIKNKQEVIDGEIIAPEEKGSFVYEVFATWKEGTAYYAFSVNIE